MLKFRPSRKEAKLKKKSRRTVVPRGATHMLDGLWLGRIDPLISMFLLLAVKALQIIIIS
jgi:hypothetical protein